MKAIRLHGRGGTERLFYEDAPEPTLEAGDALIRVHACSITKTELTWTPVHRAPDGREREFVIPGHEISGTVERVAENVDWVKPGDAVYALVGFDRAGGAAEFISVPAMDLSPKPESVSHVAAAAVPLAGLTAWQALFDHAQLSSGQKILIHGAAGGVGSFAVQFARWSGAYVIGTARGTDAEFLHRLGADEVIDYAEQRFEEIVRGVDVVFDTVGGDALEKSWRVLRPGGTLVTIYTNPNDTNPIADAEDWGVRGVYFVVRPSRRQLAEISRLVDEGEVRPVIDSTFPLAQGRAAFEQALQGGNRGKIVLQVVE